MARIVLGVVACFLIVCPAWGQCTDADGDGFFYEAGCGTLQDCNDASPTIHPGAFEVCDGFDNDCDGELDNTPACDRRCDLPEAEQAIELTDPTAQNPIYPALTWNGSGYGVAWADSRDGNNEIYFARLDGLGNKIGDDVRVTDQPAPSAYPTLVWTGSEYGLGWGDRRDGHWEVYFTRLQTDGTTLTWARRVSNTSFEAGAANPSIAWTGAEYGVTWGGAKFARIDRLGEVLSTETVLFNGSDPSLVWNGSGYGVAAHNGGSGQFQIMFGLLGPLGDLIGEEIPVSDLGDSFDADLAWTGSGYGVVWHRDGDIFFARLDAAGDPIGSEVRITNDSSVAEAPRLRWTGSEYGLVWHALAGGTLDLHFARIDAAGAILGEVAQITEGPTYSTDPSLVWTGTNFSVAWKEGAAIRFARLTCNECVDDMDLDGFTVCEDCDDSAQFVFPGAPQLCDGINNDCDDPVWPSVPHSEIDDDNDGLWECQGDCDDGDESVFPAAPQLCDGINNDCDDPAWPSLPADETDGDADTFRVCAGDCDDTSDRTYPDAPQVCDGMNNDCNSAAWPQIPLNETDDDLDAYMICEGDCDDADAGVNPGAVEVCNDKDDECDGLVDEDEGGEDTDSDGVHNLCDNCRDDVNPSQLDVDEDNVGNSCDNCVLTINPDQSDMDLDDRGDACDNCPNDANHNQDDYDGDSHGDACDNCFFDWNPTQTDMDDDYEGDICDLDDGMIYIRFHQPEWVEWQEELGFDSWNSYRGDLTVLKGTGLYTQDSALVPLASRSCDLTVPWEEDIDPPAGATLFFLTTGNYTGTGVESGLGVDSDGIQRVNATPCP